MRKGDSKSAGWRIIAIIFIAIGLLLGLSFLPLSKWTDGKVKDINILSDLFHIGDSIPDMNATEPIDADLLEAMENPDRRGVDTSSVAYDDTPLVAVQPNIVDGQVVIEDYTASGRGINAVRNAIAQGKLCRIAVVGDSYIEGDIFTQNLREKLQSAYGGGGVGYMNMYSEFPGFRKSVRQSGEGWKEYAANKKCNDAYVGLAQHYFTTNGGTAFSKYRGVSSIPNVDSWTHSQFLFISPQDAVVKIRTNNDSEWTSHAITGSDDVQAISIGGECDDFEVSISNPQLVALGVWLTDSAGVSVDCMSSRGFSGLTLTKVNQELCARMSKYIDYDLIILEFGINAMSPNQKDFRVYGAKMVDAVNHIRKCYPHSDILLMGIGDRGERRDGAIHSVVSAPYMIEAQREAARKSKCLFWDTRQAMGGEDAIVEWTRNGYANKDYIHLSHKGGEKLAGLLFNALEQNLNK